VKSVETTGFTCFDGVVGNVPGTTVNDERGSHGEKGYQISDNRTLGGKKGERPAERISAEKTRVNIRAREDRRRQGAPLRVQPSAA